MPAAPALRTSLAFDAEIGQSAFPVRFDEVGRTFAPSVAVLTDVSLDVAAGEVIAILGPSGCGKSTLLRIAAGLDRASEGSVLIDGAPVSGIDPRCAVAFQEPRLLPWRSIADNVALGLPRGTARPAAAAAGGTKGGILTLDFATYNPEPHHQAAIGPIFVENGDVASQQQVDKALDALIDDTYATAADPSAIGA